VRKQHFGEVSFAPRQPMGQIVVVTHPGLIAVVGAAGHQQSDGHLVQWDGQWGETRIAKDGNANLADA
jgi:hypothetical protein